MRRQAAVRHSFTHPSSDRSHSHSVPRHTSNSSAFSASASSSPGRTCHLSSGRSTSASNLPSRLASRRLHALTPCVREVLVLVWRVRNTPTEQSEQCAQHQASTASIRTNTRSPSAQMLPAQPKPPQHLSLPVPALSHQSNNMNARLPASGGGASNLSTVRDMR